VRPSFANLLAIAHRPLCGTAPTLPPSLTSMAGPLATELMELLQGRNGFFAFGAALHVYPSQSTELSWGLVDWNMPGLWKHEYASFVDPGLCFAQDVFGNQFAIRDDAVYHFEVETGALKRIAATLEEWAAIVLADDRQWTGWPFAQRWKERHGPIPLHKRLHPAVPFVCGGSYDESNLRAGDAAELMTYWGSFARQIRDLPDGAEIKFVFRDGEPG
jgi:hypothetical protein